MDLFGRPPASTQLRARPGDRADSNRCVTVAPNSARTKLDRRQIGTWNKRVLFPRRGVSSAWMCIAATPALRRSIANSRWCSQPVASSSKISTSGFASTCEKHAAGCVGDDCQPDEDCADRQDAGQDRSARRADPCTAARGRHSASVWVPPVKVRELRVFGGHRSRLIEQRTQARNRRRAVLFADNVFTPDGEALGQGNCGS